MHSKYPRWNKVVLLDAFSDFLKNANIDKYKTSLKKLIRANNYKEYCIRSSLYLTADIDSFNKELYKKNELLIDDYLNSNFRIASPHIVKYLEINNKSGAQYENSIFLDSYNRMNNIVYLENLLNKSDNLIQADSLFRVFNESYEFNTSYFYLWEAGKYYRCLLEIYFQNKEYEKFIKYLHEMPYNPVLDYSIKTSTKKEYVESLYTKYSGTFDSFYKKLLKKGL